MQIKPLDITHRRPFNEKPERQARVSHVSAAEHRKAITPAVSVSVFCSNGLGDALLQMIIANGLALNGYSVTFYSDYAYQLRAYIGNFKVKSFPQSTALLSALQSSNIVLYDHSAPYVKSLPDALLTWFRNNAVAYQMSSGGLDWQAPEEYLIADGLPIEKRHHAALFQRFNAAVGKPALGIRREPLVDQLHWFLKKRIRLEFTSKSNGLTLFRRHSNARKVVIHPSSCNPDKNWDAEKYVALAQRLEMDGYTPVFTISPDERVRWQSLIYGQFEIPIFNNVEQLAQFYLDAKFFVGSDSGNAHLASCLGVPTFQIFSRWQSFPSWRAGWAEGTVVTANFPACLSRKHWQKGLSVNKVHQRLECWLTSLNEKEERLANIKTVC